jgi:hypothetical protein
MGFGSRNPQTQTQKIRECGRCLESQKDTGFFVSHSAADSSPKKMRESHFVTHVFKCKSVNTEVVRTQGTCVEFLHYALSCSEIKTKIGEKLSVQRSIYCKKRNDICDPFFFIVSSLESASSIKKFKAFPLPTFWLVHSFGRMSVNPYTNESARPLPVKLLNTEKRENLYFRLNHSAPPYSSFLFPSTFGKLVPLSANC